MGISSFMHCVLEFWVVICLSRLLSEVRGSLRGQLLLSWEILSI